MSHYTVASLCSVLTIETVQLKNWSTMQTIDLFAWRELTPFIVKKAASLRLTDSYIVIFNNILKDNQHWKKLEPFRVNFERNVLQTQIESIPFPIEQIQWIIFFCCHSQPLFVIELWLKHFVDAKAGTQWIHWIVVFFLYYYIFYGHKTTEQQNADVNMPWEWRCEGVILNEHFFSSFQFWMMPFIVKFWIIDKHTHTHNQLINEILKEICSI